MRHIEYPRSPPSTFEYIVGANRGYTPAEALVLLRSANFDALRPQLVWLATPRTATAGRVSTTADCFLQDEGARLPH